MVAGYLSARSLTTTTSRILAAFTFLSMRFRHSTTAPVVTAPGSALAATEQIGLAIHGTGFSVTDVDEAGAGATAILNVGEGVLNIVVGDSGVTVDSGDGTGNVTISGTIAQIDNLLTGTGTGAITYLNGSDTPSASTTITVTVNDGGNTGVDPGLTGDATSEEGVNSQIINITAVNDAPVLGTAGLPQLTGVLQNSLDPNGDLVSAIVASAGGDPITDVDSGAVEGIAVTSVDNSNGTWQYSTNGGSTWNNFGAVTDATAVVLTDTAGDMIRFVPGFNYTGNATISFRAWDASDLNPSGTTGVDTTTNGNATAFSSATEFAGIYVEPTEILLWMSTTSDIGPLYGQDPSGVPGLDSWSDGTVIGMGDPNLSFGTGTTTGTFSAVTNFDSFAADFNVDITGLHYVTSDITVTGPGITGGSVDLLAGDVIFLTQAGETLSTGAAGPPAGWANNIVTAAGDIYAFRAENTGDYSSGYFRHVHNSAAGTTQGITLVEQSTTIGDTVIDAGDFLFSRGGVSGDERRLLVRHQPFGDERAGGRHRCRNRYRDCWNRGAGSRRISGDRRRRLARCGQHSAHA